MCPASTSSDHPALDVYLVDGDPDSRANLTSLLQSEGHRVRAVDGAVALYRQMAVRPAGVVVLSTDLQGEDGFSVCRHLRDHDPHLGIVLVSCRNSADDRLRGLEAGADAYLFTPVVPRELLLHLERMLARREARLTEVLTTSSMELMKLGFGSSAPVPLGAATRQSGAPWVLKVAMGILEAPNGRTRRLSANERSLLYWLGQQVDDTVSPDALARHMGFGPDASARHRVEVIVSRLRKNVETSTGMSLPLLSVRGTGYSVRHLSLVD